MIKVRVRIFPIAGVCNSTLDIEIELEEGNLYELMKRLQDRLGLAANVPETLMLLHNGHSLDINKAAQFLNGDQLWLMPRLSGG